MDLNNSLKINKMTIKINKYKGKHLNDVVLLL